MEINNRQGAGKEPGVTAFLSRLSHEIRTPMNTIVGSAELISREDVSVRVRESVHDIREAAEKLMLLTDDLVDIIRITNDEVVLKNEEYCTLDVIAEVRRNLESRVGDRPIEIKYDIDNKLPYRMYGDVGRIRQMLDRLAGNAVEFTREGIVTFSIKCLQGSGGSVFIRTDISDSGNGILSDDIMSVLGGETTNSSHAVEGAALGVFMAKYYATKMGGRLTVKAKRGEGSTFTMLIPQKTIGMGTLEDHMDDEELGTVNLPFSIIGARALIVEDNVTNARIEHAILHQYGIDSDICDNGRDAVELVQRVSYDIVFMDYMMPDMNGVETTQAIRELAGCSEETRQYYEKLPIIAFTANTSQGAMEMLIQAGMNDYLSKPLEISELERVLKTWLRSDKVKFAAGEYLCDDYEMKSLAELGLNIRAALSNFNGDEKEYKDVLMSMCRSSDTKGKLLTHYLEQHDYKNYIVTIHGILGVSQAIGADMITCKCRELERAAKQGFRDMIEKETPRFAENFDRLLSQVRDIIASKESDANKGLITTEDLLTIIDELNGFLAEYKINEVEELFFTLAQFAYPNERVMELIHKAEEGMLNYDYNSVIALLEETAGLLRSSL